MNPLISTQQGWAGSFLTSSALMLGSASILSSSACALSHGSRPYDSGDVTADAAADQQTSETDASTDDVFPAVDVVEVASDASAALPPLPVYPSPGLTLTPALAYLAWRDAPIPSGLTVAGYDLCSTTGPMTLIDESTECPNPAMATAPHDVLDPLSAGATYLWKVRTRFNDGSTSQWSAVRTFLTDNSLAARLRFDEGTGTTTADASGNGNNGTLVNSPAWVSGRVGQALRFGGMSYVSVPDSTSLNLGGGDFSLSAQVRTGSSGARQAIIQKINSGNGYYFYVLATGVLGFFGSVCGVAASGGNVTDGMWHQVLATRNRTTVTLYVDGATAATGTCADNFSNISPLTVGCNSPSIGCVDPFNGTIDGVTVTRAAMSPEAVQNQNCAVLDEAGAPLPPACLP